MKGLYMGVRWQLETLETRPSDESVSPDSLKEARKASKTGSILSNMFSAVRTLWCNVCVKICKGGKLCLKISEQSFLVIFLYKQMSNCVPVQCFRDCCNYLGEYYIITHRTEGQNYGHTGKYKYTIFWLVFSILVEKLLNLLRELED